MPAQGCWKTEILLPGTTVLISWRKHTKCLTFLAWPTSLSYKLLWLLPVRSDFGSFRSRAVQSITLDRVSSKLFLLSMLALD